MVLGCRRSFQCTWHIYARFVVYMFFGFWRIKLRERAISFVDVLWGARLARRRRTTLVIAEFDGWNTLRKYNRNHTPHGPTSSKYEPVDVCMRMDRALTPRVLR